MHVVVFEVRMKVKYSWFAYVGEDKGEEHWKRELADRATSERKLVWKGKHGQLCSG